MNLPDALIDFKVGAAIVGMAGAVLSLKFVEDLTTTQRSFTVFSGFVMAGFLGSPIATFFHFPEGFVGGVSFLVGLFGLSAVGAVFTMLKTADLWALIKSRFGGGS